MNRDLYLIVGLGKTGSSIARYLRRKNKPFMVFDTRRDVPGLETFHEEFPDVVVHFQEFPEELITRLTDIIVSPGVPLETPLLKKAMQSGVSVYGDIECLAKEIHAPVIAITGTNGKSTVTTLAGEMASAAGYKVAVAGNIGTPVLDMLDDGHEYDLWVLELSSFQLDLTHSLKPLVATILNITPDHLDRHHTFDAYVQAKQRIYHQAEVALFNRDDSATLPDDVTKLQCISFGQDNCSDIFPAPSSRGLSAGSIDVERVLDPAVKPRDVGLGRVDTGRGEWGLVNQDNQFFLARDGECFLPVESLLIKGVHNWLNALAACALAQAAGVPIQTIITVLKTFSGLPHRCQWVRSLDGVEWINDSKGTNTGATLSAIKGIGGAMQGRIVLIAGGQGKGADFTELRQPVAEFVRSMVLIGQDADLLEAAMNNVVPIIRARSLEDAVIAAKSQAMPGDIVLLSPACASLDMFRDFNHRGEEFSFLVKGLESR